MKHLPQLPPLTNKLISKKKVAFPVTASLQAYLDQHGRALNIPVTYEDLLRFEGSMAILDKEERALLARRAAREHLRLKQLLTCMREDDLSASEKVDELKGALLALTGDVNFKRASNMGSILEAALAFIQRNFKTDSPFAS